MRNPWVYIGIGVTGIVLYSLILWAAMSITDIIM